LVWTSLETKCPVVAEVAHLELDRLGLDPI
jgi:hypothetical protein